MQSTAQVIPFDFESNEVRTLLVDDQPWFVASDVCDALAIANSRRALSRLDEDEKGVHSMNTPGGTQNLGILNESGLYSLILTSRKAEAKRFKKWVTAEVLPAIRKHGRYEDNNNQLNTLIGQTIGTDGFRCLGAVLDGKLRHLPKPDRTRAKNHIWSQVHKAFSVVSAQDIPADKLDAVRNFIGSYALEGEWLGQDDTEDAKVADMFNRVARHRWKELEALAVQQDKLIKRQEVLQDEQRQISKQISNACRSLYDPIFESTRRLSSLTNGAKADDKRVQSFIDMQDRCRMH